MEKEHLTEKEYNLLGLLIENNYEILNTLEELMKLEMENKIESDEYLDLLIKLTQQNIEEVDIYKLLTPTGKDIFKILDFVTDGKVANNLVEEMNLLKNPSQISLIKKRIILRLFDKENEVKISKISGLNKLFEEKGVENPMGIISVNVAVKKDFINTFIKMLSMEINNTDDYLLSCSLIQIKYYLAYLYDPIEFDLLTYDFLYDNDLYWGSTLEATCNNVNDIYVSLYQKIYVDSILESELDYLSKINEESEEVNIIISQILIRVCCLFREEDSNNLIKKYLEDDNLPDSTRDILNGLLKVQKLDRELPRKVDVIIN